MQYLKTITHKQTHFPFFLLFFVFIFFLRGGGLFLPGRIILETVILVFLLHKVAPTLLPVNDSPLPQVYSPLAVLLAVKNLKDSITSNDRESKWVHTHTHTYNTYINTLFMYFRTLCEMMENAKEVFNISQDNMTRQLSDKGEHGACYPCPRFDSCHGIELLMAHLQARAAMHKEGGGNQLETTLLRGICAPNTIIIKISIEKRIILLDNQSFAV